MIPRKNSVLGCIFSGVSYTVRMPDKQMWESLNSEGRAAVGSCPWLKQACCAFEHLLWSGQALICLCRWVLTWGEVVPFHRWDFSERTHLWVTSRPPSCFLGWEASPLWFTTAVAGFDWNFTFRYLVYLHIFEHSSSFWVASFSHRQNKSTCSAHHSGT